MTDHDYINQGIQEAASKYATGIDLPAYFEGRDKKGDVAPYVAQPEDQDTGQLKPAQIRSLKIFTVSGSVVCAWVGFLQVCASGAMNTVFQYAAGAGVVVFALSGLFGGSGSSSENPTYSNRRGGDTHNHYYQNNSFGGSANQTNQ